MYMQFNTSFTFKQLFQFYSMYLVPLISTALCNSFSERSVVFSKLDFPLHDTFYVCISNITLMCRATSKQENVNINY